MTTLVLSTWVCSNLNCRVDRYKGAQTLPFNACPGCCSVGFLHGPPPAPTKTTAEGR